MTNKLYYKNTGVVEFGLPVFPALQLKPDYQIFQLATSHLVNIIDMQLQLKSALDPRTFDIQAIDLNL